MRIAVDFDGVISDIGWQIVRVLEDVRGVSILPHEIAYIGMSNLFVVQSSVLDNLVDSFFDNDRYLLPIPGALEGCRKLYNEHELFIFTKRFKSFPVKEWLDRYRFPDMEIRYSRDSLDALGNRVPLNADLIIDDSPDKINQALSTVKRAFLYNQPWNTKSIILDKRVNRVNNWADLLGQLEVWRSQWEKKGSAPATAL